VNLSSNRNESNRHTTKKLIATCNIKLTCLNWHARSMFATCLPSDKCITLVHGCNFSFKVITL